MILHIERAHAASLGKVLPVGMVSSKTTRFELECIHRSNCQFRSAHTVQRQDNGAGVTYKFSVLAHHTCHDMARPKIMSRACAYGLLVSDFEDVLTSLRPSMKREDIAHAVGNPRPSISCADRLCDAARWRETDSYLGACLRHISASTGSVTALDTAMNASGRRMIFRSAWVVAKTPLSTPPAIGAGNGAPYAINSTSLLYLELVRHVQALHGTYVCLVDVPTVRLVAVGHIVVENADSVRWFLEVVLSVLGGRGSGAVVSFCGPGVEYASAVAAVGLVVGPRAPLLNLNCLERLTGYTRKDVVHMYPVGVYASGLMRSGVFQCAPAFIRMLKAARPEDRDADALQVMYVRHRRVLGKGPRHENAATDCVQCGEAGHASVHCDNIRTAAVARSTATFGPGQSGEWRAGPVSFNFTSTAQSTHLVPLAPRVAPAEAAPAPAASAAVGEVQSAAPASGASDLSAPVNSVVGDSAEAVDDDGHAEYYGGGADNDYHAADDPVHGGEPAPSDDIVLVATALFDLGRAHETLPPDLGPAGPALLQELDPFGFSTGDHLNDLLCADDSQPKRRRVVPGSSFASIFTPSQ